MDQQLIDKWSRSPYPMPKILYGRYKYRYYYTSEDKGSIYFFISDEGDIFAAAAFKCIPTPSSTGVPFYDITEDGALQVVSCPKFAHFSDRDTYVINNILNHIIRR